MGQQSHLLRLTLGRSALEPPVAPESPDERHEEPEEANEDSPFRNEVIPQQAYNKRGYPVNAVTTWRKMQWRHAVNDVLATVGLVVAGGPSEPTGPKSLKECLQVQDACLENTYGIYVSIGDYMLYWICNYWTISLRRRFEVFYHGPETTTLGIIQEEWRSQKTVAFLFAGGIAGLSFYMLDTGLDWVNERAHWYTKGTVEKYTKPRTTAAKLLKIVASVAGSTCRMTAFLAIVPLQVFGILQSLHILPPIPILPRPAVLSLITRRLVFNGATATISVHDTQRLVSLFIPWIVKTQRHHITRKVYHYIWPALPKPTWPDRISLMAAEEDEFDFGSVAGLMDENDLQSSTLKLSVKDQLAADLQSIGEKWQIFFDYCLWPLGKGPWARTGQSQSLTSPADPSPPSPSHQAQDEQHSDQIIREQSNPQESTSEHNTTENEDHANAARDTNNQPLVSTIQANESNRAPPSSPIRSRSHSPDFSASSSTVSSIPSSPRALALYSNHEDGTVHVNLTIAVPQGDPIQNEDDQQEVELSTTRMRNMENAGSNTFAVPTSPSVSTASGDDAIPNPRGGRREAVEQHRNAVLASARRNATRRHHHRVTALSAHAADGISTRLASILTDLVMLPLEAYFVRSVAFSFLCPPGLSNAKCAPIVASWRSSHLLTGTLGWRGTGEYMGRTALVLGLQAGVGLVVWQVGVGVTWVVGRRWCGWKRKEE